MLLDRISRWALWSINCSLLRFDNNQEENVRLDSYFVFFAFLLLRFDLYFAETQVFSNKGRMLIQSSSQVEFRALRWIRLRYVVYSSIHPIAISFLRRQHQPCLVCVVVVVRMLLRYTQTSNDVQSPKTTYNHIACTQALNFFWAIVLLNRDLKQPRRVCGRRREYSNRVWVENVVDGGENKLLSTKSKRWYGFV